MAANQCISPLGRALAALQLGQNDHPDLVACGPLPGDQVQRVFAINAHYIGTIEKADATMAAAKAEAEAQDSDLLGNAEFAAICAARETLYAAAGRITPERAELEEYDCALQHVRDRLKIRPAHNMMDAAAKVSGLMMATVAAAAALRPDVAPAELRKVMHELMDEAWNKVDAIHARGQMVNALDRARAANRGTSA